MYVLSLLNTIYGTDQSPDENMILNKCNYIPCPLQYVLPHVNVFVR